MNGNPAAAVDTLRARARAALAGGDGTAAAAVLSEALTLDVDESSPTTRALGRGFAALAVELIDLPEPGQLEALFNRALKTFERAPDARLGDFLATYNNLAVLYNRHRASEQLNHVFATIGSIAERYAGPVDSESANVFMSLGELFRGQGGHAAMLVMYRQVQRYMLEDPEIPDGTRALWLQRYASGLAEAQHEDEIEPVMERAMTALDARPDVQPLSVAACSALLARRHELRGDWAGAARLIERPLAMPGFPQSELADVLSHAARAWFKAGDFDAASRCSLRAVRRRAGIEDRTAVPE